RPFPFPPADRLWRRLAPLAAKRPRLGIAFCRPTELDRRERGCQPGFAPGSANAVAGCWIVAELVCRLAHRPRRRPARSVRASTARAVGLCSLRALRGWHLDFPSADANARDD